MTNIHPSIHTTFYNYMRDYRKKGNSIAVVRGNKKMTFDTFFKEIDRVAAGLYKMGVRKGDVVMLTLPNIIQSVVATYAVSRIGAIASMIHPKLSADEFASVVEKQHPKVVFLSDINLKAFYKRCGEAKVVVCHFLIYDYMGLPHARDFVPYEGDGEEDLFYLQSGGTMGYPKTVVLSSRACNALAGNLLGYLYDKFDEKNAMLVVLPMFHPFGLCIGIHASICTNMRAVLLPQFKVKSATKVIAKNHVTTMLAVPRMMSKLLSFEKFRNENISSLEDVYVGGDTVGDELVEEFDARAKDSGANAMLSSGYGLTEAASVCAVTKDKYVPGSIGKMINGMFAKIIDDDGNELPIGEIGELVIHSDQVMSRYLDDEEATNNAFIQIDGKRWLRTGDIFKMDEEGNLYFWGRKKRLIKISGVNVFPTEIERVVKELDFVKDCACIEYRVGNKPYIKVLVEDELTQSQKQEIIEHVKVRMSHWNIPRCVECVGEFPKTKIGKTDIIALQKKFGNDCKQMSK